MNQNNEYRISQIPKGKEILFGILLGIGYLSIFSLVPLYIYLFIAGYPTTGAKENIVSSISQIIAGLFTIIFMLKIVKKRVPTILATFNKNLLWKGFLYALMVYGAAIAVSLIDNAIFGEVTTNANQSSIEDLFQVSPIVGIIFTCVLAPVVEELIFRYFIFGPIHRKNKILAYIVSGVSFGLIHMMASLSSYANTNDLAELLNDLRSLPDYIVSGLLFSFIYYKTKTILGPIISHMIYNGIATVFVLISIANLPVKISNVTTFDEGISFQVEINANYDVNIDKVSLVQYEDDETTIKIEIKTYTINEETKEYTFSNLTLGDKYYIKVVYSYETFDDNYNKVNETKEVTTYAYAIE